VAAPVACGRKAGCNIELRDRGKDIIISGGENISSIEVEQAMPPGNHLPHRHGGVEAPRQG